jgi:tRNA-specific 2-thiouridylase
MASRWRARFDSPQWAPTPGQYLVVYDGEVCLGGAVIESASSEGAIGAGQRAEGVAV